MMQPVRLNISRLPRLLADPSKLLTRMTLTLAHTHDHASGRVGGPGRGAPSTKGRVWAVVFAFAARCARADGRPGIEGIAGSGLAFILFSSFLSG